MNDKLLQFVGTIYEQGYGLIAKKVIKDKSLSFGAKGIYSYLCAYAGSDGRSFPSTNLIMHELNITKKTFYKYLNELVQHSYISKQKIRNKEGKFDNNVYLINAIVPMVEKLPHGKKSTEENLPCGTKVPTTNNNIYTNNNISSSSNKEDMAEVYKQYQSYGFGTLTKIVAEIIEEDVKQYSREWFLEALKVAVKENKLKLSYVEGILQNWKRNGGIQIQKEGEKGGSSKYKHKSNHKQAKTTTEETNPYDFSKYGG